MAPFPSKKRHEQEQSMSKLTLTAVVAVLGLTVLAGCQRAQPEPVEPIFVEPVSGKTR
jgi:hypothetical protein